MTPLNRSSADHCCAQIGFLGPAVFLTQLGRVHTATGAVLCMMASQGLDAFSQSGLYSNHQVAFPSLLRWLMQQPVHVHVQCGRPFRSPDRRAQPEYTAALTANQGLPSASMLAEYGHRMFCLHLPSSFASWAGALPALAIMLTLMGRSAACRTGSRATACCRQSHCAAPASSEVALGQLRRPALFWITWH